MSKRLEDLDITKDEVEKICDALKDKEFRQLFSDYIDEINDPENKKKYEEEITQLERDRGIDVTFVHPESGYVIKTSADGKKKTFLNICYNDLISKPTCNASINEEGKKGYSWSIPYTVVQPREDLDKNKKRCDVYDVIFHSETLHLASKNKKFRDLVSDTACTAVEQKYGVQLDHKNLKYPKITFKGWSRAAVIRKDIPNAPPQSQEDIEFYEKILPKQEPETIPKRSASKPPEQDKSAYTIPKYIIKQRRGLNLDEFLDHKNSKLLSSIPTELVIEVELPLLKTSANVDLDVTEKSVKVICEKPSKYKLSLSLPYSVSENNGNAKFDKEDHRLIITLPVKVDKYYVAPPEPVSPEFVNTEDSGVDSDDANNHFTPPEVCNPTELICESTESQAEVFLEEEPESLFSVNTECILPNFTSVLTDNVLLFTLHVKNVEPDSLKYQQNENVLVVKFTSIGSGYFPQQYGFCFKLENSFNDVKTETWDNTVTVQLNICSEFTPDHYYAGLDMETLENYQMPQNESFNENNESDDEIEPKTNENPSVVDSLSDDTSPENENSEGKNNSSANKKSQNYHSVLKNRSVSESSNDEGNLSPHKRRGILKRGSLSGSVSESSVDEHYSLEGTSVEPGTSLDAICGSLDTCEEKDSSLKKTVRFNDVISQQKFRSHSSILGQKKKNQRKARNKKRAHERKLSESENSEAEEKMQENGDENKFTKHTVSSIIPPQADKKDNINHIDFRSDMIFHLDM